MQSHGKNSTKSSANTNTNPISLAGPKRGIHRTPSEELILGAGEPGPNEIVRTTEYQVEIDENKDVGTYGI